MKKNKRDEVISPAAADSDVESESQQPKEEVAKNENNEEDVQKNQDDTTQRASLQLSLKLQNEESTEKCDGKAVAPPPSTVPRKRKWGTSAKPTKSTTIDISTDSLKGLIPDIKPSSIKEAILDLSHDDCSFSDHEEEKVEVKFRRTVQMKEEEEEVELVTTAREVLTDADLDVSSEVVAAAPVPIVATAAPIEREPVTPIVVNQQAPAVVVTNKTFTSPLTVRRVSHQLSMTEPEEPMAARRSPSPAHNPVSKIVHVRNLVRPFTIGQLKELLKRTGVVVENGFWIDKIKSHCFAKYETEEQAILTRKALHGTKWPSSNPKILRVEYATDDEVSYYRSKEEGPQDIIREIQQDVSVKTVKSVEKSVREMKKKEDIKKVREWDRGKTRRRSRSASCSQSRSRSRERKKRALSGEKREKKEKKVIEEEAPAKLLDDLFRKTKAVPCIYWLPLTESQIADRERERRQRQLEREQRRRELEKEEEAERKKRREMEEKRKDRPERSSDKRAGSSDRARKDKREENWRPNRRPSSRSRSRSRRH